MHKHTQVLTLQLMAEIQTKTFLQIDTLECGYNIFIIQLHW